MKKKSLTPSAGHRFLRDEVARQESEKKYSILLAGGGPGALATILALANKGKAAFRRVVESNNQESSGIAVVTQSDCIGSGSLRNFENVPFLSNSPGPDWTNWLPQNEVFGDLQGLPEAKKVAAENDVLRFGPIADLLDALGDKIHQVLKGIHSCDFFPNKTVDTVEQCFRGDWNVYTDKNEPALSTTNVILATGGKSQPIPPELHSFQAKIITADSVHSDIHQLHKVALAAQKKGGVVWVGSSYSVGSGNYALIEHAQQQGIDIAEGGSHIVHRSPIYLYFPNSQEAELAGYTNFSRRDIDNDPNHPAVHRWKGIRNVARDLILAATSGNEKRITSQQVEHLSEAKEEYQNAQIIIVATGYPASYVRIDDSSGMPLGPKLSERRQAVCVTDNGQVIGFNDTVIPGVYANGLAHAPEKGGAPLVAFNAFGEVTGPALIKHILETRLK